MSSEVDLYWMKKALGLASRASDQGEVPVGAIIVKDGKALAWARNEKEALGSALGHAECLAIHRASRKLGGWRLTGATLYVTLEPCLMCAGAIQQARIDRVVFGARDPKGGAVETLYQVLGDQRLNHRCDVRGGVLAEDCGGILSQFFKRRRTRE